MKNVVNLIVFFLAGLTVNAQDITKTRDIIGAVIGAKNIIYQDSVSKGAINLMREAMKVYKAGVFYGMSHDALNDDNKKILIPMPQPKYRDNHKTASEKGKPMIDTLILSQNEVLFIQNELSKMAVYKWPEHIINGAELIPTEKVNKIFADNIFKGWAFLKAKHIDRLYSFAPPIFLRNDTYCLFYYGYGCGDLCGEGEFALYKREKGKWVKIMSLSSWVS